MTDLDGAIDIGNGHAIHYAGWHPDRSLNPQYADAADIDQVGVTVLHVRGDGQRCAGFVHFDLPEVRERFPGYEYWTVESRDPLTLAPSILCKLCGDHGYIRAGRWVAA